MALREIQDKIKRLPSLKYYDIEEFVKFDGDADKLTKELGDKDIKTSQLRKFFAAIKEIELYTKEKGQWDETTKVKFYLLMPKLAYANGRDVISDRFFNFMKVVMGKVGSGKEEDTLEDFYRLVQFLESIIAFYKVNNPNSK
ncbi:type III-A CRISPR-associated protein Csm2 [uncultured Methanobrevibacter sp.]|uniref:type III-A CRISPR-associated protein Csm2 n=1 Tax=uncultured Methanobrevibacter sp. TaxID=253161 RepID=UPI00260DA28C